MGDTRMLKIVHASLEVFDTDRQTIHDIHQLATLQADILAGTESGNAERQALIRGALVEAGYRAFVPPATDGWVAVKPEIVHSGWDTIYKEIIPGARELGHASMHPHAPKGVIKVSWDHQTMGHIGVIGGGHYLTKGRFEGQWRADGCTVDHIEWNKKLARAMSNAATNEAAGSGLGFFTADTNLVDRDADVFYDKPLTSCWDELGIWPDTGHGNIDVIASVNNDGRVSCERAYVLDDDDLEMFSDHFVVVADYRVQKLAQEEAA